MTLPTLDALCAAGFTVELFGKPWVKSLFAAYPYPIHTVSPDFWQMRRIYQQAKSRTCIVLTNSLSSALPLFHSGIAGVGYRKQGRHLFLHRSLKKQAGLHEIEYFWQLAQFAVDQPLPLPQTPRLLISEDEHEQAKYYLKAQSIVKPFFVVCPGATGHGVNQQSKVWPHWLELTHALLAQGKQVIACPMPQEVAQFKQILAKEVILIPNLNLPLYAAVMQQAQRVIANDSGPMHLAAAVGASVLGIFGQTDPRRTHPWGGEFIGQLGHWPSCEAVISSLA